MTQVHRGRVKTNVYVYQGSFLRPLVWCSDVRRVLAGEMSRPDGALFCLWLTHSLPKGLVKHCDTVLLAFVWVSVVLLTFAMLLA